MYNTSYFKEKDPTKLLEFVENYPLATLIAINSEGVPVATQVPVLVTSDGEEWIIRGHVMRNSDHHKAFVSNPNVLAIFTGPNAYVSASWHSDKQSGSTWNYMSVHATGHIRITNREALRIIMQDLSLTYEDGNSASPTVFENLPKEYQDKMLPAIDGFEIRTKDIKNVFKLSQNRDQESYSNIIAELARRDIFSRMISEEMKARKNDLFG